jgi:hypothetical protein
MIYDPIRTRDVVNRLVTLGNRLQFVIILISAVFFGVLAGILGALVAEGLWGLFALVGLILGTLAGLVSSAFLVLLLEWMAQLLIATGRDR